MLGAAVSMSQLMLLQAQTQLMQQVLKGVLLGTDQAGGRGANSQPDWPPPAPSFQPHVARQRVQSACDLQRVFEQIKARWRREGLHAWRLSLSCICACCRVCC